MEFHAKTYKGLENILAKELEGIGAEDVKAVNRGVNFMGSLSMLYKANLYLRTALRILMPIAQFKVRDEDDLYRRISRIDWSEYMTYKNSFAIDATVFSKTFRNSHFVELRIKDAIVDQFRKRTSVRPSVDLKNAEIRINVHVSEDYFVISLDSSGESLHRRGYKKKQHRAALSEVLAAGLLQISGYKGDVDFINPMCGSGTLGIEAAMIACDIYPGSIKRTYAMEHWPVFDRVLFDRIVENMPQRKPLSHAVVCSDIDPESIAMAKINSRELGLEKDIKFEKCDFLKSKTDFDSALLIMNPPYGERLKIEDEKAFYSSIGGTLKHNYPGTEAYVFTANLEAVKFVGLKAERKIELFNAGLECKLVEYKVFKGDRKSYLKAK